MKKVKDACKSLAKRFDKSLKGEFIELEKVTEKDKEDLGDLIFKIDDDF